MASAENSMGLKTNSVDLDKNSMKCGEDMQYVLVTNWKTRLPFSTESRISFQSIYFADTQWSLHFEYTDGKDFHCIYLQQVIDGKESEKVKNLEKPFHLKCCMLDFENKDAKMEPHRYVYVRKTRQKIWCSGETQFKIYQILPWLYDRTHILFQTRFYEHPPIIEKVKSGSKVNFKFPPKFQHVGIQRLQPQDIGDEEWMECYADFSLLLEEGTLPDVRLVCGNRSLRAHKCVLGARSNFFLRVFQNELPGKKTGFVKISGMDDNVFDKFVKFLYSGTPDLSEECIDEMYKASRKYDVPELKIACSRWIIRHLTVETSVKYLRAANYYADLPLKNTLIYFIKKVPRVLKTREWILLSREVPSLGVEVLQTNITLKSERNRRVRILDNSSSSGS